MSVRLAALRVGLIAYSIAIGGCSGDLGGSASSDASSASGGAGNGSTGAGAMGSGAAGTGGTTSSSGAGAAPQDCSDAATGETPPAAWQNATGNLAEMPSECGNLTLVAATPCSTQIVAGVALKGLWASEDGGATWLELGSAAGSATITNRPSSIVHDPAHPGVFWTSGIYNGAGVHVTHDAGVSFEQLGSIGHNDLVSVDLADPERKTLLAGGHEQKQTVHRSTDSGQSWTNIGATLPDSAHFSSYPVVLDASTYLVGACGWGGGTCGIWRTADGGASWSQVSDLPAQAAPLRATDSAIYWPLGSGGIATSTDGGLTWTEPSSGGLRAVTPIELPDGRLVTVGQGTLVISSDGAATWSPIGEALPFDPAGVTYSALTRSFFVWHWDCGGAVLADAIAKSGFDWEAE